MELTRRQLWLHSRRWSLHLLGACSVVAMIALDCHAYRSLRQRQDQLAADRLSAMALIRDAAALRARHAALTRELSEVNARRSSLLARNERVPDEADLMGQLSELTRRCDLSLKDFRPSRSGAASIDVRLSLVGSYASLCRFLDSLSEQPKCFRVTTCDFAAPKRPDDPCTLDLTMRATRKSPQT